MAGRISRAIDWAFPAIKRRGERQAAAVARRPPARRRSYTLADGGRLNAGWNRAALSADAEIRGDLDAMRARARELAANDPYAKRFLRMVGTHVIGRDGIRLRSTPKNLDGKLDKAAARKIEAAWSAWCKRGVCTRDGRQSFAEAQKLIMRAVVRDGEFFVQKLRGRPAANDFGFSLGLYEADFCDARISERARNGNEVRLGVEVDAGGRPVAFQMLSAHPGDRILRPARLEHRRVLADEIIHAAVFERASQSRGVSWFNASGPLLHMLAGYREAELIAARIGSSKMGFYTSPTGEEYTGDDSEPDGELVQEVEPGIFEQLPEGVSVESFDVDHPNAAYPAFNKEVLRGAASGFGVSYNSLGNDLEGVNFSSMRHGAVEERDEWQTLQDWFAESVLDQIFEDWLEMALLSGMLPTLNPTHIEKYKAHEWEPRGWGWVDPVKEGQANELDLSLGLSTATSVVRSRGHRLEDVLERIAEERELYAAHGLIHPADRKPARAKGATDGETEGDDDEQGKGEADNPDA